MNVPMTMLRAAATLMGVMFCVVLTRMVWSVMQYLKPLERALLACMALALASAGVVALQLLWASH